MYHWKATKLAFSLIGLTGGWMDELMKLMAVNYVKLRKPKIIINQLYSLTQKKF